jgi:hypothetical protein
MTDPVRRVNYFFGQLLSSQDFEAEQDYHRRMRYLHNRLLGQGIVEGFAVAAGDGSSVVVSPGVAIDRCGREVVLSEDVRLGVPAGASPEGSLQVTATWAQEPDAFVVSTVEGDRPFSRWLERPAVALVPPDAVPADAVVLGRAVVAGGEVASVDLDGRATWRRADGGPAPVTDV